ncbi:MAG: hypothetical protein H0V66_07535 [Bdellovibrionales bacterium]|nr:hypothetical protein [Bdellovibrionales bacterium]
MSKDKVVELYQNGSIKADDEICSGNGYWFFIRENELVEKYLLGNSTQSFNPISEAKDVLTSNGSQEGFEPTRDDITMVGGINLQKVKEAAAVAAAPAPKVEMATAAKADPEAAQKKKVRSDSQAKQSSIPGKPAKQNYIAYLGFFILIVLVLIIYYRKTILKTFLSPEAYIRDLPALIISQAHAQNDSSGKKKSY